MHEAGFGADGVDLGNGDDARPFQQDAVAFHMPEAFVFADQVGAEALVRLAARHAAADDVGTAARARQAHLEVGDRLLFVVRQDLFLDDELRALADRRIRLAVGIGHAAQLRRFQDELRALFEINFGDGVEDLFARAVAGSVMALHIAHLGVFGYIKGVDAVVLRGVAGGVVDAAPGDDGDFRPRADIKIVVDGVMEVAHRQQYGDVHRFIFDAGSYDDVDAVFILFGDDLDIRIRIARQQLPVFADIEAAFGDAVQIGDGL